MWDVGGVGSPSLCSVSLSSPALCFSSSTRCTHAHIGGGGKKAPHSFSKSGDGGQEEGIRGVRGGGQEIKAVIYCLKHQCVVDWSGLEPKSVYTEEVATMCCVRLICNWHRSVRGL